MSLLSWDSARPWARSILRQVTSRRMPPFHARGSDFALANDITLSAPEIEIVRSWVEGGAERGDPGALPTLPDYEAEARNRPRPDLVLDLGQSFTVPPHADMQRAFTIRNELGRDVWVRGVDYEPDLNPVVHHMFVFTDPSGRGRQFQDEDPELGFLASVDGGDGTDKMMEIFAHGGGGLGGWAPGAGIVLYPDGVGQRLAEGTDLVLQYHYWNNTGEPLLHRPKIGIFLYEGEPDRVLDFAGPSANDHIDIRPGDAHAEHWGDWTASEDLEIVGVMPHMHFLGRSMKLTLHEPGAPERLLVDVPDYDFEWQTVYQFEEPIAVRAGTRVEMVASFDNTGGNPRNVSDPPRLVTFGERSDDEMADGILFVARDRRGRTGDAPRMFGGDSPAGVAMGAVVRFGPNGVPGVTLQPDELGRGWTYYRSETRESTAAGVALEDPQDITGVMPYDELVYILEGEVEIRDEKGHTATLGVGDAAVLPRGVELSWRHDQPLRKYWVTWDHDSATEADSFVVLDPGRDLSEAAARRFPQPRRPPVRSAGHGVGRAVGERARPALGRDHLSLLRADDRSRRSGDAGRRERRRGEDQDGRRRAAAGGGSRALAHRRVVSQDLRQLRPSGGAEGRGELAVKGAGRRRWRLVGSTLVAGLCIGAVATAQSGEAASRGEWRYWGGDRAFTRYSPLDQIDRENVSRLQIVWRRQALEPELKESYPDLRAGRNLRTTPIYVDGVLYATNAVGLLAAIDPATGATIWRQKPFFPTIEEARGTSQRGVDFWTDPRTGDQRLFLTRDEYLYSVVASSGALDGDFGDQGRVSLHRHEEGAGQFNWTAGPIVADDVIIVAGITGGAGDGGSRREAVPEDVSGYDARSGRRLWTFHVVPRPGEHGHESWGEDSWTYSGDLGSWCCLSVDEELGLVYVPLSAPTAAYYGGHRPGHNLFSNSLVALDHRTGERAWHFQMVHHDVWEYDTVGPATLGRLTVDGRTIDAVMQPSKTGFLYVFDRRTGEPVWPIEERPVPQSTVPNESLSPTQPFPTKPPPFDRQGFTESDLVDFTPELRARALELVEPFVLGPLFNPPSLRSEQPGGKQGTLTNPGWWGAGNWHTGAFDPETGFYYAVSHTWPTVYHLSRPESDDATLDFVVGEGPYVPTLDGLPIVKPPYGRITAFDMNRGELVWMTANGDGPRDHPLIAHLDPPPLGVAGRAAPLVTGTLLFLGEGSDAIPGIRGKESGMSGKGFRAYDKGTGEVLWKVDLPGGVTGAPMTYLHRGKQYVVMAIGDSGHPAELIAFALP